MKQTLKQVQEIQKQIVTQMLSLSTSAFGLVAALAWNEVIKTVIEEFVKPYLGSGSGLFSLVIYAVIVTVIAVLVTLQLTQLQQKLTPPVK